MHVSSSLYSRCLAKISGYRRSHSLGDPSSSTVSTSIIPKLAAASLIGASTGLGCFWAWTSGAHQGPVLAALLVLCALGLELAKPFSIAAAFDAFRSWRVFQGTALALLGIVCITYSLTAELSLMATSRGDLVAERSAQTDTGTKANDRYDRAKLELLTLPTTRPKAELEAKIAGLLQTPGADGCTAINGKVTREICPQVSDLRAEAARAERREKLEATMQEAERETASGQVGKAPDPGATALVAYLALVGIDARPALLTELLILVGVLALEVGSALSLVMVRAVAPAPLNQPVPEVKAEVVQAPVPTPLVPVVHADAVPVSEEAETAREEVKKRVLKQLRNAPGGRVAGSQRGLAKLIGADKSTMRRAINSLTMAGIVAMEATRNGTMLRLIS